MSVFTALTRSEIEQHLNLYSLGQLVDFSGIASGVENSNYFLTLQQENGPQKCYVLTLFERLSAAELPFFVQLTSYLHHQQRPVPCALANKQGTQICFLAGKPAVIVPKIDGKHCTQPSVFACAQVGAELARIHVSCESFQPQPNNSRDLSWLQQSAQLLQGALNDEEHRLLSTALAELEQFYLHKPALPRGIIHGDLFRDNVLFDQQRITAIIDFYNACQDDWLYDVAITVNDWCVEANGTLDPLRTRSLLAHYHKIRPFTAQEEQSWPVLLLMAACRFWVSRLIDWQRNVLLQPEHSGHPITIKDPLEFQRIVQMHLTQPSRLTLRH